MLEFQKQNSLLEPAALGGIPTKTFPMQIMKIARLKSNEKHYMHCSYDDTVHTLKVRVRVAQGKPYSFRRAPVAQWIARRPPKAEAAGSNPARSVFHSTLTFSASHTCPMFPCRHPEYKGCLVFLGHSPKKEYRTNS